MSPGSTVDTPRKDSPAQPRYAALLDRLKQISPRDGKAFGTIYNFFGHPLIVLVVIGLAVWSVWDRSSQMAEVGDRLIAPGADRGIVSLELARSAESARDTLGWWQTHGVTANALCSLDQDAALIRRYQLAGLLLFGYCLIFVPRRWQRLGILSLPLLVFGAGALDRRENNQLRIAIADATHVTTAVCGVTAPVLTPLDPPSTAFVTAINSSRTFALLKFTLLTGAWCGVLGLAGIQLVRLRTDVADVDSNDSTEPGGFEALHRLEVRQLPDPKKSKDRFTVSMGPGQEQWVATRDADLVGLAMSGGGIRSATFNLGLLQGFSRFKGVLPLIDFVSTVSGGGYLGGAWSAWRARVKRPDRGESFFVPDASPTKHGETPQVRHLREFSKFLIPRWGVFEVATWQAVIAVVAGLIPALLTALSVLLLAVLAYVGSTFYIGKGETAGAWMAAGVMALAMVLLEIWWILLHPKPQALKERDSSDEWWIQQLVSWIFGTMAVGAVFVAQQLLSGLYDQIGTFEIWSAMVVPDAESDWILTPRLFEIGIASLVTALAYIAVRFVLLLFLRSAPARPVIVGFDRVLMRILGVGTLFVVMAAIWHLGLNLRHLTTYLVAATGASGGTFALLRNWLTTLEKPQSAGPFDQIKKYVPQVLAYLTLILASAAIASVLVNQLDNDLFHWWLAGTSGATALMLMLFVDPQAIGLHRFYCDRLARAYAGASNPQSQSVEDNRQYDVRRQDDVLLSKIPPPHHLICCAANNLAADQVTSLSRGATSAVLSRNGVTIGDRWGGAATDLGLSSAVTASAAAFNPNMGSVSVTLGPAVAFLMAALNLRLGLWVRQPGKGTAIRAMPGWLFFKEMFQATRAKDDDVHLSDGGHFENLGLYELVRRHCRYIIVSDASADPDVAFDDFGIAARRIRQDFGVDIRIDLSPLKHDEHSYARQHVVVGLIDYDGGLDKGVLLYIKPSLTGDEEPDVRQYRERNKAFPHESTGDQFYDEAQWESYRRLGDHTGQTVLRHLRNLEATKAQDLFMGAREEWIPTPADFADRLLAMTGRLSEVESNLRELEEATVAHEIFPELELLGAKVPERNGQAEVANLSALLGMLQLMEDVHTACELDTLWNHPLNLGWMNCFARWATAPTFRQWWPILSPMYGSRFVRFMRDQFTHLSRDEMGNLRSGAIKACDGPPEPGLAWSWWSTRLSKGPIPSDRKTYTWNLELRRSGAPVEMQVGLVAVSVDGTNGTATWDVEDFFIPPSLWNAGIGGPFLRKLCEELETNRAPVRECRVTMREHGTKGQLGRAGRAELLGAVEFYKYADFQLENREGQSVLVRRFAPARASVRTPS